MEVRSLTLRESLNLGSEREFNHLRVDNLEEFLLKYQCNTESYRSPFEVLAELERQIKFENNPDETIFCSYKADGDVIFDLVEIKEQNHLRILVYQFFGFAS